MCTLRIKLMRVHGAAHSKDAEINVHLVALADFFNCEVYPEFLGDVLGCIELHGGNIKEIEKCIRNKIKISLENKSSVVENDEETPPPTIHKPDVDENNEPSPTPSTTKFKRN